MHSKEYLIQKNCPTQTTSKVLYKVIECNMQILTKWKKVYVPFPTASSSYLNYY